MACVGGILQGSLILMKLRILTSAAIAAVLVTSLSACQRNEAEEGTAADTATTAPTDTMTTTPPADTMTTTPRATTTPTDPSMTTPPAGTTTPPDATTPPATGTTTPPATTP